MGLERGEGEGAESSGPSIHESEYDLLEDADLDKVRHGWSSKGAVFLEKKTTN